jgi:hypothetical protein
MRGWYIEQCMEKWSHTILMLSAIRGAKDIDEQLRNYRESLMPSGKTNEELIKRYKDVIKDHEDAVLEVRSLQP